MGLNQTDWIIISLFFLVLISIGLISSRKAGNSYKNYFLSGGNMPWWLLGVSMVATTFSCDTPNLVTDIVRQNGVSGNWVWWAFLLTGMLTVFVYAKLWNRSKVNTDLEFYELRYSGKMAAFLRGFRALYLGFLFNIIVIASVSIALIKIIAVMLGWPPAQTLIIASVVVVFYTSLGGLRSILYTDFYQFGLAMVGAVGAAVLLLNQTTDGLAGLWEVPQIKDKMSILPDLNDRDMMVGLLIIPLAVQWWSVWYPGAEPGGGGYIAQRMLSAKNEKHAVWATLLFNFFHYALRPWPWIIVAMISLIVYPDLESLKAAFPDISPQYLQHDLAYPAMLRNLPHGFLGLVVASLIAAFMSTTASQLNWGSSYIVNDFYSRFLNPNATEAQKVRVGRLSTIGLMAFAVLLALMLENALQAFHILLQIGAGTGLIYLLRWFWWRINAYSEITGMLVSFLVALGFLMLDSLWGIEFSESYKIIAGVGITTMAWLLVTFFSPAVEEQQLIRFYQKIQPGGPGWKKIRQKSDAIISERPTAWDVPLGMFAMFIGTIAIYSTLFATGFWLYNQKTEALFFSLLAIVMFVFLTRLWRNFRFH